MTLSRKLLPKLAAASLGAAVTLAGVWAVKAAPSPSTRAAIGFAGTLQKDGKPMPGPQSITFAFKKNGQVLCSPKVDNVNPDPSVGFFNVEIPLGSCPATLFDGSDVTFDVTVAGVAIATSQKVSPVPYAKLADQLGTSDCPVGYALDTTITTATVCKKGADEVVRVGSGPTAFWIDRYEASVWSKDDGTGTQYGAVSDDYPSTFPDNGQWTIAAYAVSKGSVSPSAYLTWFQANEACRASGKRLPNASEWLTAARGTVDPVAGSDGANGGCRTQATGARNTGAGTSCRSAWGAEDMVGNLSEWTQDWAGSAPTPSATTPKQPWPQGFGDDMVFNLSGTVVGEGTTPVDGMPAAVMRGGNYGNAEKAGIFAVSYLYGPSGWSSGAGFRCVIPR